MEQSKITGYHREKEMKLRKNLRWILMPVGAVAGYLYYFYVGCPTGTCPLSSNPFIMTLYGALMGYLLGGIFLPTQKKDIKSI